MHRDVQLRLLFVSPKPSYFFGVRLKAAQIVWASVLKPVGLAVLPNMLYPPNKPADLSERRGPWWRLKVCG